MTTRYFQNSPDVVVIVIVVVVVVVIFRGGSVAAVVASVGVDHVCVAGAQDSVDLLQRRVRRHVLTYEYTSTPLAFTYLLTYYCY